jgi:hypothetical protein
VPQPHGGALNAGGTPGNRGGGRPPDEFKRRMAEMASSDAALSYLEECLTGTHGPEVALRAQQYAADRGYGKPSQPVEHTGKDGEPLRVEIIGNG